MTQPTNRTTFKSEDGTSTLVKYKVSEGEFLVVDTPTQKRVVSENYNMHFDKKTGVFHRWGKRLEDDPSWCPIGPEILDIEISKNACPNACRFCYKGNTSGPATNMSFDTFKKILDKMPKSLTQVALGITGTKTNPDFIRMMEYCQEIGVVPNFTLSGLDLTDEMAKRCSELIGAVAVSAYKTDKNVCYNTVKKFVDLGIKQTNIHLMVSDQTKDFAMEVLQDRLTDPRLAGMNAIVLLGLKPKGRARGVFHPLEMDGYDKLISFCLKNNIAFGFDSCSAPRFEQWVAKSNFDEAQKKVLVQMSEPCESSLFSAYINENAQYWHCSFAENEPGHDFVDILAAKDFIEDVWMHPVVKGFREKVQFARKNDLGNCTIYPEIGVGRDKANLGEQK